MEFPIPIRGVSSGLPVDKTPNENSSHMNNVRPRDVLEKRLRIGQRPGIKKWSSDQVGAAEQPVVAMCVISSVA